MQQDTLPLQVLVVDDNRDAADAMVMAAQVLGHEALACYDGPAALARLEHLQPGLIILDLSMPGMDGYALARAIRQRPALATVPMVALSGFGADADRERSLQAGFDMHLLKPMEIDTLEQVIARARHGRPASSDAPAAATPRPR